MFYSNCGSISLSRVISKIFMSKKFAALKSWSRVSEGHWKWCHPIAVAQPGIYAGGCSCFPFLPSPPLPSPPLPLEVCPQIQLGGLGERCKLPQRGLGRSPGRNRLWCIFSLKIRHLVATILRIFVRVNWTKHQTNQLSLYEVRVLD